MRLAVGYVAASESGELPPAEREAALVQICASRGAPEESWMAFLGCQYRGEAFRTLPEGWQRCAAEAQLDAARISACLADPQAGTALEQALNAARMMEIGTSPTIVIDDRIYLGGLSGAELTGQLCWIAGSDETRPPACQQVPRPRPVTMTVLHGSRCEDAARCDVSAEVGFLAALLPNSEVVLADYATPEGQALYVGLAAATPIRELPAIVFDEALDDYPGAKQRLGEFLVALGSGSVLALGNGWNPTAEICDNGEDDDGNAQIDCSDASCAESLTCRAEAPRRLDLYIMSQCPYATRLLPVVAQLVEHFGRDRKALDLRLEFIGEVKGEELSSLHGPEEVAEDLRLVCAQKLSAAKYDGLDYAVCRARDPHAADWRACLPKGLDAKKLEKCAGGPEGRGLLMASFARADRFGVNGSPSWILNEKKPFGARTLEALVSGYCAANEVAACAKPVAAQKATDAAPPASCKGN